MRASLLVVAGLLAATTQVAAEEPLVAQYLYSGKLARGEQVMESAIAANPTDDQLRLGLAMLQLTRSFERLGQSLYQYGCHSLNGGAPLMNLPLPANPDPSAITYADLCRMLDGFYSDVANAELTLSEIKSDDVRLRLRMADIRLNLAGREDTSERYRDILQKSLGPKFSFPRDNPELEACFDRGDVAALRAYCHVLMGLIDIIRAYDLEEDFTLWGDQQFAKLKNPSKLTAEERSRRQQEMWKVIKIAEPARLGHFRRHVIQFCELSRESWGFIRRETDDDREWLPNARQTGVLGIPVTDDVIEKWLKTLSEVESLYDGKKGIPASLVQIVSPSTNRRMNLKTWLDNPPDSIDWERIRREGVREQYLDDSLKDVDIMAVVNGAMAFHNVLTIGFAAWFR